MYRSPMGLSQRRLNLELVHVVNTERGILKTLRLGHTDEFLPWRSL
jgi:hypothetical protein